MLQITRSISAYNHSAGNPVKYIVLHDTGSKTDTPEDNARYFGSANRNASAHYFVGDNSIVQVVEDNQGAWHVGDGREAYGIGNHNSIGIEMCNLDYNITEATLLNAVDLVKAKMIEHNVPLDRVVRHWDASRKNCPESWSPNNWATWYRFKALVAGSPITIVAGKTPNVAPVVSRSDETPIQAPLHFSYPNNAKVDWY